MIWNYRPIQIVTGRANSDEEKECSEALAWELDAGKLLILQGYGKISLYNTETSSLIYHPDQILNVSVSVRLGSGGSFVVPDSYAVLRSWLEGNASLIDGVNATGSLPVLSDNTYWEIGFFVSENPIWPENVVRAIFKYTPVIASDN